ncbi:hypothetical protein E2C01_004062 [Portunus trituberculatus]|uniref:Uncharacterized protein n=1 Tax=Portunus trituberculatus TaxID=210409 RepID=A0A5B7CQJ5_PORTR|nr:hypothetical protein [Portunus trituberculatus]
MYFCRCYVEIQNADSIQVERTHKRKSWEEDKEKKEASRTRRKSRRRRQSPVTVVMVKCTIQSPADAITAASLLYQVTQIRKD